MLPPASVQWVGKGMIFCAINSFNRFATAIKKTDSLFHVLLIVLSNMKCMLEEKRNAFFKNQSKKKEYNENAISSFELSQFV